MSPPPASLLGPEQAALMTGRVSILVGSRDEQLRPHVMRASGCRLSDDLRRVTLLMPERGSEHVLADLRSNGRIAAVFTQPSSNRTVQVKGDDAVVSASAPEDAALAERYRAGFVAEIGGLGFAVDVAHTIISRGCEMVAVHFTVAEAFDQTPGPAAGEPLRAAAVPAPSSSGA